jgi:hypothetical protein
MSPNKFKANGNSLFFISSFSLQKCRFYKLIFHVTVYRSILPLVEKLFGI